MPIRNSWPETGRDLMVSIVPFSYSRAMTSEVSMAPTIMMMMAMMPGMMKFRLSRSSLNQTRMRPSTGGLIFSIPCRLRNSSSSFLIVPVDKGSDVAPGDAGEIRVAAVQQDLERGLRSDRIVCVQPAE